MKKYLVAFFLVSITLVFPVFVQGQTTTSNSTTSSTLVSPTPKARPGLVKDRIKQAQQKNLEIRENLKMRASDAAQKRAENLSEARLKLCKTRANLIANRIRAMLNIGTNRHKRFENLVARVDEFYTNKLVPNGYSISNYNDLKAEIEANEANVQALLDAAKESGQAFDCSSDDPKGQAQAFHDDIKNLIEANQEYKESIKAFVTAVRDLTKTAKLDKISPSASPSATPEVAQ